MKTKNDVQSPTNQYTVEPEYLQQFMCIGDKCSDSCCSGWNVTLDKQTFKNYRRSTSFALKRLFDEKIVINRSSQRSESNFAKIKMESSGDCPFLDNKLCSIQKLEGAQMLSETCSQYPRLRLTADNISQIYLTPSCPEASRLILSSPSAMALKISSAEAPAVNQTRISGKRELDAETASLFHFTALNILSSTEYPLWRCLAALGTMCWLVEQEIQKNSIFEAEKIILALGSNEDAVRMFIEGLTAPEGNIQGQAQVFSRVWKMKGALRSRNSNLQKKVMSEISSVFFENEIPLDDVGIVSKYHHGMMSLETFNTKEPHFMRNYILNDMGRNRFPLTAAATRNSPWEAFLSLTSRYGVLRFMLAVRAGLLGTSFEKQDFIETVSVFSRKFEHDSTFSKAILTCFQSANFTEKYFSVLKLIRDDFKEDLLASQTLPMESE